MGEHINMNVYMIQYSQNMWEYTGYMTIQCNTLEQIDSYTIKADGVVILLDEEIGKITRGEHNDKNKSI